MTIRVRVMDEYSSDWPLWLDGYGQETESIITPDEDLRGRLQAWAQEFEDHYRLDDGWDSPVILDKHIATGAALCEEVQRILGPDFSVE